MQGSAGRFGDRCSSRRESCSSRGGALAITAAPGPNGVVAILTVNNLLGQQSHRLCTQYATGLGSTVEQSVTRGGNPASDSRGVRVAALANRRDGAFRSTSVVR